MALGMMSGQLSDGRLQVWLSKNDGSLWTSWKTSDDPDSGWATWHHQAASSLGVTASATAPLPNRALQIWAVAAAGFNPPYQTGSGVDTTWKTSTQSTAPWHDWVGQWSGEQALGGGAGAAGIAAGVLKLPTTQSNTQDRRIQLFIAVSGTNVSRLLTTWKKDESVDADWMPFVDFPSGAPGGVTRVAVCHLTDGRLQLFASGADGTVTSWKLNTNPNAKWTPWHPFGSAGGHDQIVTAQLSDGRPQLWRVSQSGTLDTCFKVAGDPSAAWSAWAPHPGAPKNVRAFTAGSLNDGRVQIWAADVHGAVFTTWKASTDPDAAWRPWVPFAP